MHRRLKTDRSETVEVANMKVWIQRYYTDQRFGKIAGICAVNTVYLYVQLGALLDPGASLVFVRYTSSIQPAKRYIHTFLLAS